MPIDNIKSKSKIKTGSLNPKEERLCNNPVGCSDFVSKQLLMNLGYNQTNKKEFDEALQAFKKTTGTHDDAWRIFGHIKQNKGEITYQNIDNTAKVDNLKKSKIKVGDVIALRNNTGQSSYQAIADANNLYDKKAKNVNSHVGYVSNIDEEGNIYVDHYLGDNKYRRDILKNDKGKYKLWKTDHTNKYTGEQGYFGEYDVVGIARPNVENFKNQYAEQIKNKEEIKKQYDSYKLPENIINYKTDNKKVQAAFDDFKKSYKVYGEITGLAPAQLEKLFYITLGQAEQETKSGKHDISENIYATNIGIPIVKAAGVGIDSIVKSFKSAVNTVSGNKPLLPAWKRQILIDKDIEQGLIPKDKVNDKEYIEQYITDRPDKFGLLDEAAKEYTPPSRGWLRAKYISPEASNLGISPDAITNSPDRAFVNSLLINSDNYYSLKNIYKDKYSDDELMALTTNSYNSSLSKNKEYVDHFLPRQKIDYTNKVYSHIKDLYGVNMPNYKYVEKENKKTKIKSTDNLANPELKMNNKYGNGGKLAKSLGKIGIETLADQTALGKGLNIISTLKELNDTTKHPIANILNPGLEALKLPSPVLGDLLINGLQEGLNNIPKDKKPYQQNDKYTMNKKFDMGGFLNFYNTQIANDDAIKQAIIGTVTNQIGNAKQGLTKAATMGLFGNGGPMEQTENLVEAGETVLTEDGKLVKYPDNGLTHEKNPEGGFKAPTKGYAFSNRPEMAEILKPFLKGKTPAKASIDIDKRYSKRPDDKISKEAKERELNNLMQIQESTGMTNKSNKFYGGGFMDLVNKIYKYIANDIRGNKPRVNTLDKEIDRQNTMIDFMSLPGNNRTSLPRENQTIPYSESQFSEVDKANAQIQSNKEAIGNLTNNSVINQNNPTQLRAGLDSEYKRVQYTNFPNNQLSVDDNTQPSNTSYKMDQISPWWLAASNIGNLANLAMSRPSKVSLDRVKPSLIDTYRSNTILRNELRTQANQSNQDIRGTANTAGSFLAASVNNTARNNNIIGSKIAESNLNALNTNVGIKNATSAQNAQIQASEQDLQQRENDASKTIRSNAISSIGNNTMQYGLDRANVNMTNKMMNYITPQGYELVEAEDGTIRTVRKKGSGSNGITFKSIS